MRLAPAYVCLTVASGSPCFKPKRIELAHWLRYQRPLLRTCAQLAGEQARRYAGTLGDEDPASCRCGGKGKFLSSVQQGKLELYTVTRTWMDADARLDSGWWEFVLMPAVDRRLP